MIFLWLSEPFGLFCTLHQLQAANSEVVSNTAQHTDIFWHSTQTAKHLFMRPYKLLRSVLFIEALQ